METHTTTITLPRETLWVISVIESCEMPMQMELCENLIKNYKTLFDDAHIEHINEAFNRQASKINYHDKQPPKQGGKY